MAGSHDKSEWLLFKASAPNVEVGASREDFVNKTQCPKTLLEKLTTSERYILKVRYHDANNDIWSDYGSIEFTTKDKFFDPNINPNVDTPGIKFKVAKSFSNEDFFINGTLTGKNGKIYHYWVSSSDFIVEINGQDTNQRLFSITANTGDTVLIKPKHEGVKFPMFSVFNGGSSSKGRDYISEILEPFPAMWETDSQQVTSFRDCFYACSNLTSIPENLFANCTQVTSFQACFYKCSITSIPAGLFNNCTQVTTFENCFNNCSITSIPENLFANCTQVTKFEACFWRCTSLTIYNLRITARNVNNAGYFASENRSRAIVRVPRGSTTAYHFRSDYDANCNVIEE